MTRITALVPEGEHFDATALNEGIWFTEGHVNAIEAALEASETSAAEQTEQITSLTNQVTEANTARTAAETNLATANATIESLNEKIAKLSKSPASAITGTVKEGADQITGNNTGKKISATTKLMNEKRAAAGLPPIQ